MNVAGINVLLFKIIVAITDKNLLRSQTNIIFQFPTDSRKQIIPSKKLALSELTFWYC